VEGTFPTPLGVVKVRHTRGSDGDLSSQVHAPEGIVVLR